MGQKPYLIDFPRIGDSQIGYLSVAEESGAMPFAIKRAFWTYHTPESIVRGRHAHLKTEMVIVALAGRIIVNTENRDGKADSYVLEKPDKGLYIPTMCWHTMQYSHTAVQLVLASEEYDKEDYIRDFDRFKSLRKNGKST